MFYFTKQNILPVSRTFQQNIEHFYQNTCSTTWQNIQKNHPRYYLPGSPPRKVLLCGGQGNFPTFLEGLLSSCMYFAQVRLLIYMLGIDPALRVESIPRFSAPYPQQNYPRSRFLTFSSRNFDKKQNPKKHPIQEEIFYLLGRTCSTYLVEHRTQNIFWQIF